MIWEIERQGRTRSGKGEHSDGWGRSEVLEHRQERSDPRSRNPPQNLQYRCLGVAFRNDALILEEAPRTVNSVPVQDAVQRIEEAAIMPDRIVLLGAAPVVIKLIEELERPAIDQRDRRCQGHPS